MPGFLKRNKCSTLAIYDATKIGFVEVVHKHWHDFKTVNKAKSINGNVSNTICPDADGIVETSRVFALDQPRPVNQALV